MTLKIKNNTLSWYIYLSADIYQLSVLFTTFVFCRNFFCMIQHWTIWWVVFSSGCLHLSKWWLTFSFKNHQIFYDFWYHVRLGNHRWIVFDRRPITYVSKSEENALLAHKIKKRIGCEFVIECPILYIKKNGI